MSNDTLICINYRLYNDLVGAGTVLVTNRGRNGRWDGQKMAEFLEDFFYARQNFTVSTSFQLGSEIWQQTVWVWRQAVQSPNLAETSAYPCRWLFSHHGGKEKMNDEKKKTRVLCEVRFTRKSKIIEEFWGPLCQNRGERKYAPTNFTKCGAGLDQG